MTWAVKQGLDHLYSLGVHSTVRAVQAVRAVRAVRAVQAVRAVRAGRVGRYVRNFYVAAVTASGARVIDLVDFFSVL